MGYYRVCVFSHIGNSRALQEDNYIVDEKNTLIPEVRDTMTAAQPPQYVVIQPRTRDFCAFVCDGMGGQAYGEVASYTAVQLLSQHYDTILRAAAVSREDLSCVISKINADFCEYAERTPTLRSMGTTLCGVVLKDCHMYCINAGDSRLYVMRNGDLEQVTIDHTEGQRLMDLGFLSEAEAIRLPHRKAIYKHLGQKSQLLPDVFETQAVVPGTILMLTTDGLTDALDNSELCNVLSNQSLTTEQKGKELVARAITKNLGYGDNITVILIEM